MPEIDLSALLSLYVYLDIQDQEYLGKRVADILQSQSFIDQLSTPGHRRYHDILRQADFADIELESQSAIDGNIPKGELIACAFGTPDGTYCIAYRGTGDGKWIDNGEGMYKASTPMQERAAEYFDGVALKKRLGRGDRIIVTGHSKGGNSAQFVTLAAQYARRIGACYSFDGQGFSHKAVEAFRQRWGDGYPSQIGKMLSINGENDYVHVLGIPVIPAGQTVYVYTGARDFAGMHDLARMITDGRVLPDASVQQGIVGAFAQKLSDAMMRLDEEHLKNSALAIMSLIERYMGGGENRLHVGTGDVTFAGFQDFRGFAKVGLPLILQTALGTREGRILLAQLAASAIARSVATKQSRITRQVSCPGLLR